MSRRDEILAHTEELIQIHGFNGFSYQDLSSRLGIRKASIHYHFPSKEDLGIAYCDHKKQALTDFKNQLETIPSDLERLDTYLGFFSCLKGKGMCTINALQSDISAMPERLKEALRGITQLELEILTKILRNGREKGVFQYHVQDEAMAYVISSALKGGLQINLACDSQCFDSLLKTLRSLVGIRN